MSKHHPQHDWKKYLIVFLITLGIFLIAIYLSSALSNKRFEEMRTFQDKLATDILSSETRFALLERTSCQHFVEDAVLAEELGLFGNRLATMERQLDSDDPEVAQLKRYYSLLQIKDYLLVTQLAEKCDTDPVVVMYFYEQDCPACERQGFILNDIQKDYNEISLYSFDYHTELSAVRTLISTFSIPEEKLPVLVIDGTLYPEGLSEKELRDVLVEYFPEPSVSQVVRGILAEASTRNNDNVWESGDMSEPTPVDEILTSDAARKHARESLAEHYDVLGNDMNELWAVLNDQSMVGEWETIIVEQFEQ